MRLCQNGHEMTAENTGKRYRHGDRERFCRTCRDEAVQAVVGTADLVASAIFYTNVEALGERPRRRGAR